MALQHTTIGNGGEGRSGIAFSLSIPIQPNDESCPQLSEQPSASLTRHANKAASMALRHTTVRDGGEGRSGVAFSPCTRTQRRGLYCQISVQGRYTQAKNISLGKKLEIMDAELAAVYQALEDLHNR